MSKWRVLYPVLLASMYHADAVVAANYECKGKFGKEIVTAALRISDARACLTLRYDQPVKYKFSPLESVEGGFRFSELMPGEDDERIVSRRLFQFREAERKLIYIEHQPDTKMLQAECMPVEN